ncbi:peritrophin-55 [Anastrepha ludens]|uniref:peritrophin-55 n=1 Tax=Anastrepha ludens TaxID=28586 RepID=UPI0023AEDB96|nr:peritrophin-55 [Anastrepha ludens]
MRVFALTVTTLCLAVVAQGSVDYQLSCDRDEIGIRWPSYHSNSEYYMCTHVGGRQLKMSCGPGELFTFVLQACTTPGRFIPPPPAGILPLSSSFKQTSHAEKESVNDVKIPKPLYPIGDQPPVIVNSQSSPVSILEHLKPPSLEKPVSEPPHADQTDDEKSSNSKELEESVLPSLPGKPKPSKVLSTDITVPVPPTPEPTPPVVKKQPGKKPPPANNNNKSVETGKKPPTPPKKNKLEPNNNSKSIEPTKKSLTPPKKNKPMPPTQS